MSDNLKILSFKTLKDLAIKLRDDLNNRDYVLLYAYNGTGKTRLSMAFKERGKKKEKHDTLYFNAYTEDLFSWNNDLGVIIINSESSFSAGFRELALEEKILPYFHRYSDLDFKINYDKWEISFSRNITVEENNGEEKQYRTDRVENIKVSRGEENIFIWCVFLAICELVIDGDESYSWVKYIYIDDPISSLDDNNAIAVASDLASLLITGRDRIKTVISSHHALFFNVMCNELNKMQYKKYFLYKSDNPEMYTIRKTDDTPFFHHVAMLSELKSAAETGRIYTYHFNMMRNILEKTSTFFGYKDFSACITGIDDEVLYSRAVNLLSHGKYSIYEPREMMEDTRNLFKRVLNAFLERYKFDIPELLNNESMERTQ